MKKCIQKMLFLALAAAIAVSAFTGCTSSSSTEGKYKIGIAQSIEHTSLNQIRDAILARLNELGYTEETAEIDYQNAQGDQAALSSICSKFQGDKKDIVIAIGTTTAQAVCGSVKELPVLFSSVTDPVGLGLVESYQKTNQNRTGIANYFPLDDIFKLAFQLTPDIKKIGFIHCSSEYGAAKIIEDAQSILKENYPGVSCKDTVISNSSELSQAVQSMVGKVDAIFVPNDSVVASAMPVLSDIARKNKIPVYVTADSLVMDGGLATVGINYEDLGKMTADTADEILKGKPVSEIPVKNIDTFRTVINQSTSDQIALSLPESIASSAQLITDSAN